MVCIISCVTDLMKHHLEMSNRIVCILGAVGPTIVFTGYQEKRRNGVDWYSPPYYTHSHGYKMCMNVYLKPTNNDLRVYSYLLPGEYDDDLKWPFRGTVVVQLLNQLSEDDHYDYVFDYSRANDRESQMVTSDERSYYKVTCSLYLPLADLKYNSSKGCQYLKNDCLKLKVFVKNL